ncbi:MAG: FAD-dependent oxidoreductase, partial [Clostridia bacterium]
GLERFVADKMLKNSKVEKIEISNGKKVAVVGGGPSSLTCAADLKKAGFDVTIFEAFHKLGGVLVYGIPEFRLPKDDIVEKEIENVLRLGVKVKLNTVIGKTITMEELIEEFDAVYIGSGAGLPLFLGIEGETLRGVFSANEYLTRVNLMQAYKENSKTPIKRAKNAIVIGGGNVAMDGARTALRLGANVTVVYRRSREEMPARAEEVRHAEEEGVNFQMLTAPLKVLGENGQVKALLCEKMRLGEPDASNRRSPIAIENSEFEIPCDMLIVALGTSPNPIITSSFKSLQTAKKGTLVVDDSNMTSVENVYAGGDAVTGAATVILAMGAGRNAAKNIIEKLGKK